MGRVILDPIRGAAVERIDTLHNEIDTLTARLQAIETRAEPFIPSGPCAEGGGLVQWSMLGVPNVKTRPWGSWFPTISHAGVLLFIPYGIGPGGAGDVEIHLFTSNNVEAAARPSYTLDSPTETFAVLAWSHGLPLWERGSPREYARLEVWAEQTAGASGTWAVSCPSLWFTDDRGLVSANGAWWLAEWPPGW